MSEMPIDLLINIMLQLIQKVRRSGMDSLQAVLPDMNPCRYDVVAEAP